MYRCAIFVMLFAFGINPGVADQRKTVIDVENGILRLIDDTAVPASVSGTIDELHASEGTRVVQGQLLASVDSKSVQLQLDAAKIDVEVAERRAENDLDLLQAEKSAGVAKAELDRVIAANQRSPNTFLSGEVDRYRLLHELAELGVRRSRYEQSLAQLETQRARNKVALVETQLSKHQIISPCDGVISKLGSRLGEWVEPGHMMFQIVNVKRLQIDGFVSVNAADVELIGKSVIIEFPFASNLEDTVGTIQVPGTIAFVSPEINPVDSMARILIEFDNQKLRMRPGKRIAVKVVLETSLQ